MTSDSTTRTSTIAFIGGGNMARSLIGGLVARGVAADSIRVAEPVAVLRDALHTDFGVQVFTEATLAVEGAELWLVAVKPQVMREVCASLAAQVTDDTVVVSIAAGITIAQLQRWLARDGGVAVVRAMPNTPALLGAGITGLCPSAQVTPTQRAAAQRLLEAAGHVVWIDDEAQMDAVTAVSGSGPAYVFLLAEAMQAAAVAQGLDADAARALATQTLLGASRMLAESDDPADVLRARVTSPNGTTQAAIETFEAGGFRTLVARAIDAATRRGRELSAAND